MNEFFFHILDTAHGIVTALLVVFIFRLLVFRKEGSLRIRYLAIGLLIMAVLQSLDLFEEGSPYRTSAYETIAICLDGCALLLSALIIWLFYRNRHIYPVSVSLIGSGTLIAIIFVYILCALFRFAEWTYPLYLIASTVGWVLFSLAVERIPGTAAVPLQPSVAEDPFNEFRLQLEEVMRRDNLFCNEELTREDVCRAMRTNRTTFSQKLKQAYDKTFSEYLRDIRLQEAARLLRETDLPIDQVAFSVGLKSPSGFHHNFLLSYGMTPAQYREQHSSKISAPSPRS